MDQEQRIRVAGWAGLITAFFLQLALQPTLNYINPVPFTVGALILVLAVPIGLIREDEQGEADHGFIAMAFVVGGCFIAGAFIGAGMQARHSRSHCLRIEEAMLRPPKHVRSDLPAVFTALGCRPQA